MDEELDSENSLDADSYLDIVEWLEATKINDMQEAESKIENSETEFKISDIETESQASGLEEVIAEMDGEGEVDSDSKSLGLHPLMLPEILSHVLSTLESPRELHMCRKVCSVWNQEAVKVIQRKVVVTLRSVQAVIAYCAIMDVTQDYPHRNFRATGVLEFQCAEIMRFFDSFGPAMRTLHIDVWGNRTNSTWVYKRLAVATKLESLSIKFFKFCNIISNMDVLKLGFADSVGVGKQMFNVDGPPFTLPKLRHLILDIEDCCGNAADIERFLRDVIVASSATLEKISFASISADVLLGRFVVKILGDTDVPLRKLREVNFLLRLTDCDASSWAKKEISLRQVKQVATTNLSPTTLSTFLQSMNSTLQKYCLTAPFNGNIARMNIFPCKMKALTHLHLNGFQGCLSTLSCTPNLKSLILENADPSGMLPYGGYFADRPPCESLTTLKILSTTTNVDSSVILRISDYFPNLTSLSIVNTTDDALDMMYKHMPFLKELYISGDNITDEAICGIPNRNCLEIMNTITFFVVDDFVVRKYLFIGNLCNLESLTIKSNSITDLSVMFGVARTLKLEKLCIKSKGITDISLSTFERMHLTHLDISDCPNFTMSSLKKLSHMYVGETLVMKKVECPSVPERPEFNANRVRRPENVLQFEYKDLIPVEPLPLLQQRLMFIHQFSSVHAFRRVVPDEEDISFQTSIITNERAMRQLASLEFSDQLKQVKNGSAELELLDDDVWFNA